MKVRRRLFAVMRRMAQRAATREGTRIERIYRRQIDSQREEYFGDLTREKKLREGQLNALQKAHKKEVDRRLREQAAETRLEMARLRKKIREQAEQIEQGRKAYALYHDYSNTLEIAVSHMDAGMDLVANRVVEARGLVAKANYEVMIHMKRLRKMHPRVCHLLGIDQHTLEVAEPEGQENRA